MITALLFEHINFGGRTLLIDNPTDVRYLLAPWEYFDAYAFNDVTSSIQLRTNVIVPSTCIAFQNAGFSGDFIAFAYDGGRDIASLPTFNDEVSSVLLVEHPFNWRDCSAIAVKLFAGNQLNQAIDKELAKSGMANRRGDVQTKFAIDLRTDDGTSFWGIDLMLLETPVTLSFRDYQAIIRYWLRFFIDGAGQVQATVVAWGYWLDGGLFHNSIEPRLRQAVQDNVAEVQAQVSAFVKELDFHTWTDVYLLPGQASLNADFTGNINDDCTIVLVPVAQPPPGPSDPPPR